MHTTTAPSTSHPPLSNIQQTNVQASNPPADAEHTLKRAYLNALPPAQVVDLCLTLDGYIPPHVKSTLWPADLQAAIAALQAQLPHPATPAGDRNASPYPHGQQASASHSKDASEPPPMASLTEPPPTSSRPASTQPQTIASLINSHQGTPAPQAGPSREDPEKAQTTQVSQLPPAQPPIPPTPSTSTLAPSIQGPYPHAPYGFTQPHQSAYPHAAYYPPPPPPPNYAAQYPGHNPPYPYHPYPGSHPHHPYPPPPNPQPSGSPFTSAPLARHPMQIPPDPNVMSADDLPSYEDMIVEALGDLDDPEGCAPKALFSWMASHYPLQTNFRPSASQALQKAYKKGRLEKSEAGKYRLNVNWEGGPPTRRTTRRPQTMNQTTLGQQPPPLSSPFTHAPLQHSHHMHAGSPVPNGAPGQPPYPNYPYPYSRPPGFPPFTPYRPPPPAPAKTAPSIVPTAEASSVSAAAPAIPIQVHDTTSQNNAGEEDVGEGSDAWVAAQNILKAINFGSFLQDSGPDATAANNDHAVIVNQPKASSTAPPPPVFAARGVDFSSRAAIEQSVTASANPSQPPVILSTEDRASLQAQLALLAAQLAEIAEDTLEDDLQDAGMDIDVAMHHALPSESAHQDVRSMEDDDDDSDDDDDMEPVPVPVLAAALQT
ncbi:hypothetical protein DENSPDRAFT_652263 [Dentipellis sp. KUC8613]|nr:hypothetical protein DENSPDRAFT_652263 [Dentipellis sp. KUC8613]